MNDRSHIPIVFQIPSEVVVCVFFDVFVGDPAIPFSVIPVFGCLGGISTRCTGRAKHIVVESLSNAATVGNRCLMMHSAA